MQYHLGTPASDCWTGRCRSACLPVEQTLGEAFLEGPREPLRVRCVVHGLFPPMPIRHQMDLSARIARCPNAQRSGRAAAQNSTFDSGTPDARATLMAWRFAAESRLRIVLQTLGGHFSGRNHAMQAGSGDRLADRRPLLRLQYTSISEQAGRQAGRQTDRQAGEATLGTRG